MLHLGIGVDVKLIYCRERRAQQLIKELLADGKGRSCAPDKQAARKRASFIRATLRQARNRKPQECRSISPLTTPLPQACILSTADTQTCAEILPSALDGLSDTSASDQPRQWLEQSCGGLPDNYLFSPGSINTSVTADTPAETRDSQQDETHPMRVRNGTTPITISGITSNRDSTVLNPSGRHEIRQVFSRRSFSSSMISDLLSLIEKRFSLSTFETSSRRSVSTLSVAETEISFAEGKASEVLDRLRQTVEKANTALTEHCCSKNNDCRHRYITRVTVNDLHLTCRPPGVIENELHAAAVERPLNDSFGNSELFFAARIGAPAEIFLSLLKVTNGVNAVNADGQTFLFFLDPQLFPGRYCSCPVRRSHLSKFECLVRMLERCNYNFDHLDNYGRHFLSFLLASPAFDIQWLFDLMRRDDEWQQRVHRTAQLRDADGVFMIDYMALRSDFDTMGEDIRSQFRPLFVHNPAQDGHSGILTGEDDKGQTPLHQYLQREFLHSPPLHGLPFENTPLDLNRYSCRGRTPTMDFLLQAFEQELHEDVICAKVQQLIRCGANVNTRSRGGSTILHFAAKTVFPKLTETLLASDIQVDHRDNAGLSALDYAAKVFNRSRSVKAPAELTARSLKSTAQLLGFMLRRKDRTSGAGNSTKDFNERPLKTLQRLLGHEGQQYPPSPHRYTKLVFLDENSTV